MRAIRKAVMSISLILIGGCAMGTVSMLPESMKTTVSELGKNRYEIFARTDFKSTYTLRFEGKAKELCPGGYKVEEKTMVPQEKAVRGIVKCK